MSLLSDWIAGPKVIYDGNHTETQTKSKNKQPNKQKKWIPTI